jgi:hypothetical protein
MKLFEQVYKAGNFYYHVSPMTFEEFIPQSSYIQDKDPDDVMKVIFFTSSMYMIQHYVEYLYGNLYSGGKIKEDQLATLYQCTFTKNLNLFRMSNKLDLKKLYSVIKTTPEEFLKKYRNSTQFLKSNGKKIKTLKQLFLTVNQDPDYWEFIESPVLIKIIRDLGYDGFIDQEAQADNVAIFSPNVIKIVEKLHVKLEETDKKINGNDSGKRIAFFDLNNNRMSSKEVMAKLKDIEIHYNTFFQHTAARGNLDGINKLIPEENIRIEPLSKSRDKEAIKAEMEGKTKDSFVARYNDVKIDGEEWTVDYTQYVKDDKVWVGLYSYAGTYRKKWMTEDDFKSGLKNGSIKPSNSHNIKHKYIED